MTDQDKPNRRNLKSAAVVSIVAVLFIVVAIFVGLNFYHAESPKSSGGKPDSFTSAAPIAPLPESQRPA